MNLKSIISSLIILLDVEKKLLCKLEVSDIFLLTLLVV